METPSGWRWQIDDAPLRAATVTDVPDNQVISEAEENHIHKRILLSFLMSPVLFLVVSFLVHCNGTAHQETLCRLTSCRCQDCWDELDCVISLVLQKDMHADSSS